MEKKEIIAEAVKEARTILRDSVVKTVETTLLSVKADLRNKVISAALDKSYTERVVRWDDVVHIFSKYMDSPKD